MKVTLEYCLEQRDGEPLHTDAALMEEMRVATDKSAQDATETMLWMSE